MKRSISQNGLKIIKKYEGCRLKPYKDYGGVWTIGYGHTGGVQKGATITKKQADTLLKKDCKRFEEHVNSYMGKYEFNQNQFDALVSFAYNIGNINQLTNKGRKSLSEISNRIPLFCNCNGTRLKGLVNRRNEEKLLFDTPIKKKTLTTIAKEVVQGKWGNGNERKKKLSQHGYNYNLVQQCVNKMLKK